MRGGVERASLIACGALLTVNRRADVAAIVEADGVLYVNPGSAGPRRFRLPVALARLRVSDAGLDARIVELPA